MLYSLWGVDQIQINKILLLYYTSMLQRSYIESQYESLYAENTHLRDRVRKYSEIEPYVELLLQNNRKYQQDIQQLQVENTKLRGRVDAVLEQSILLKEAHQNQMMHVRSGFEADIERLIRELKEILKDKEAMQDANQNLIEQLTNRSRKDIEAKKRQIEEMEIEFNRKLNKMAEAIKSKEKTIEELTQQLKFKQGSLLQQIDQLSHKISVLTKDKEHLGKQIQILNQDKRNLIRKNKQLSKQNEEISTKYLKSDQEKNESLIQLKNKNIELGKRNEELDDKIRLQQKLINEQSRKIAHLTKQCDDIMNIKNQIEGALRRNIRALEELKGEHAEVVGKLNDVSKTTEGEIKRQGEQLLQLSEENKKLNRQNVEIISENKDKTSQIEDLLRAVQKLQRKIADLTEKCSHLQNQNSKKSTDNKNLTEKLEDTLLQKKSLNQKLSLYSNHNLTLQEMLEKEKRRNTHLQTSRFQIETIAMGALSKPEQICRQYERQIEKIVQQFVTEKQQIELLHHSELLNLKSAYEEALKQKDEYFSRKIMFLQKQMITLRTLR